MKFQAKVFTALILAVLLGLMVGCQEKDTDNKGLTVIDLDTAFRNKANLKLSEWVDSVELVLLESTKDSYFLNPRSYTIGHKFIMIADDGDDRIILFDRSGNFVRNIGRKGKGPGEFSHPWQAAMDPAEEFIYLADGISQKLIKYNLAGELVKEISTQDLVPGRMMDQLTFLDEEKFLVLCRRPGRPMDGFSSLLVFDRNLNLVERIFETTHESYQPTSRSRSSLYRGDQRMIFWETGMDTLYTISPDLSAYPTHVIHWDRYRNESQNSSPNASKTLLFGAREMYPYLMISGMLNEDYFSVVHNQESGEVFTLNYAAACDTVDQFFHPTVINDLYGIEPVYFYGYEPQINRAVTFVRPDWINRSFDYDCLSEKEVPYEDLRDQILEISRDPERSENMILILLHLRNGK